MAEIKWTTEQRRAIETVDRDALVSAAAGSGKTAVLAERCAYLVADAPVGSRCDVDALLVVTFTDAAAAEMRSRIHASLKVKAAASPSDERLRGQVALVDTSQISTLHSFCMWIVRRWFQRAGVDATSPMLAADEGVLLRQEAIDGLFEWYYAGDEPFSDRFRELIEDYGLGNDASIKAFVLKLAAFLESIPDPDAWLVRAGKDSPERITGAVDDSLAGLRAELQRQYAYCVALVERLPTGWRAADFYVEKIVEYQEHLDSWRGRVQNAEAFDAVRGQIEGFEQSARGVPRTPKDADPDEIAAKEQAKEAFDQVRGVLQKKRLQSGFCRFTSTELAENIAHTMPFVQTLIELARGFREAYRKMKREAGVMDFSDLERLAYELLTEIQEDETHNLVVAELQHRFAYVLVDEFQDINPLQARILSLVSRSGSEGTTGNLFTVGDVKQSIYRFRLAEPNMFLERASRMTGDASTGVCINLQHNYRSTRTILNGVNLLFGALMSSECGGIAYDEEARLKSPDGAAPGGDPIELHLLERKVGTTEADEDAEPEFVDASDPLQWKAIEREAALVGERIQALMNGGMTVAEDGIERPLRYADICVLLRSVNQGARHVASVLGQMGISCWAQQAADSFSRLEVREVLALLAVIDNLQQDIPLATVLRCGILGERLSEDELVQVRGIDREFEFHETVQLFASKGRDGELRAKLVRMLATVQSYRRQMRERPLADVLWSIYRETGYLSYVVGLDDGVQRRANLIALHDRARQFGQFRRQGLRRFLHYLDSLRERGEELGSVSAHGESDDAVGIFSIHRAKGLEYPVVFVMELGRRFNLGDSSGRILFEREIGIGPKRVDRERLIEYPTALHRACALATEESTLAEELRVWYVATTRAKQKLILIGTLDLKSVDRMKSVGVGEGGMLDPITILSARTPAAWIVGALGADVHDRVRWNGAAGGSDCLFEVTTYGDDQIAEFGIDDTTNENAAELWTRVARLDPLPESEPVSPQPTRAERVIGRLEYAYPHLDVCSVGAVRSASEKTQSFAKVVGEDDGSLVGLPLVRPAGRSSSDGDLALRRGTAVHAALQHVALDRTAGIEEVEGELKRLGDAGLLSDQQLELVDAGQIAWFFSTDLGGRVRAGADAYHREWMFLSAEPIVRFDPLVQGEASDRVLVRGVVDGVLNATDRLEIIDYKTDRISADQIDERAKTYQRQLGLYASAVGAVFGSLVGACHLVFLHPKGVASFSPAEIEDTLAR